MLVEAHMITTPFFLELENLRHKWGWLLSLGILMIVLGTIAAITTFLPGVWPRRARVEHCGPVVTDSWQVLPG